MHDHSSVRSVAPPRSRPDVLIPLATVSGRHGLEPLQRRLCDLRSWLADDLRRLEGSITEFESALVERAAAVTATVDGMCMSQGASSPPALPGRLVRGAAAHLLSRPGKRIRPLCVLLAARAGGRRMDGSVRDLAVACELVHAATLLHDDVIDDSTQRRGAPAARVLFGNSASILAGDHLLVEALRLVNGAGVPGLVAWLLDVISEMVAAEAQQLERRGRFTPDGELYLEVIRGKTAALFSWGLRAGGRAGGLDEVIVDALGRVGTRLGMAFQLVDDVLDLEGDAASIGKEALVDLREGKLTWPMIVAAERDPSLCQQLEAVASADAQGLADDGLSGRVVEAVRRSGAIDATRQFALEVAAEAAVELRCLPAGAVRDALQAVVESAVHRAH